MIDQLTTVPGPLKYIIAIRTTYQKDGLAMVLPVTGIFRIGLNGCVTYSAYLSLGGNFRDMTSFIELGPDNIGSHKNYYDYYR